MSAPLIAVHELTIGWGDVVLLKNASFEVERGDIFVILGGSGCGKSTLMRYLVGLDKPMHGEISVNGQGPGGLAVGRPAFGVMFQSGALLGSMTVEDNIALPLREWTRLPADAISAVAQAKLRLVGLQGTGAKLPSELSGGMKKRAGIARAMALEPELIFLDEPSAGLDPVTAVALDELLLTLNQKLGLTLVVVTHDLESIFKIAKHCVMLDRESQSIIAQGDPRELREHSPDPRVRNFFNRSLASEAGHE